MKPLGQMVSMAKFGVITVAVGGGHEHSKEWDVCVHEGSRDRTHDSHTGVTKQQKDAGIERRTTQIRLYYPQR